MVDDCIGDGVAGWVGMTAYLGMGCIAARFC